jgi:RNA recognition motif-containing protein
VTKLFSSHGTVTKVNVAATAGGRSKGFGTVSFSKPQEAQAAVKALHDQPYGGRILTIRTDYFAQ